MAIIKDKLTLFIAKISQKRFGYLSSDWLLDDLPNEYSFQVRTYFDTLNPALVCDKLLIANTFELKEIIDEAIWATHHYSQAQQIVIGSQCNRMMKHVQIAAIYFCHYEVIGNGVVTNLYQAMNHLYGSDLQPDDEYTCREMLRSIANVTCAVKETAQTRLQHLKTSEEVMRAELSKITERLQPTRMAKCAETSAISKFIDAITKSSIFWQRLVKQLESLTQLTKDISFTSTQDAIQSSSRFGQYKGQVIQISAGWIAIMRICRLFIKEISPQLKLETEELTVPVNINGWDEFNKFACTISIHFEDLHSLLMGRDFNMQSEVNVYSTWIKPTMNESFPRCLETVNQVSRLVETGRVQEASKKLMEVSQLSRRTKMITEVYIKRLEELEKYAECQQKKLMRKMEEMQENRRKKRQEIHIKEVSLAGKEKEIAEFEELKLNCSLNQKKAEKNKRTAMARQDQVKTWWWVPLYGQGLLIRELIEDNSLKIAVENKHIQKYEADYSNLQNKIQFMKTEIVNLNSDVHCLSSKIDELQDQLIKRNQMLKEMKEATASLKNSVYHWNEFAEVIDFGDTRSGAMQKLITKGSKLHDPARILRSRGTQAAMKSFTEAFERAERILQNQWQYMVTYEYVCVLCRREKSGLPLPVDEDTVVCNECAHKYIK